MQATPDRKPIAFYKGYILLLMHAFAKKGYGKEGEFEANAH